MSWIEKALDRVAQARCWRYLARGSSATEPAALVALALLAHGRARAAQPALKWLTERQASNGSLGVSAAETTPGWTTSLAVLAWKTAEREGSADYQRSIESALAWILATSGAVLAQTVELGHDSMLVGWPWVAGTHSWIELTALGLSALKATGRADHPRAREAVRLLIDRILPGGGCNYGNTFVLGQPLRAHVQPTGIALAALAGETDSSGRVLKSVAFLRRELSIATPTASLCYGLLGLAAHDALPADSDSWLASAAARAMADNLTEYKLALLALAGAGSRSPLIPAHRTQAPISVSSVAP